MSSTRTAVLPLTSPMTYPISATCWAGRSLSRIASSAPTLEANFLLSLTRPASGATTTRSVSPRSSKYCVSMNSAVMWSTGLRKKPWIWPACRSIVSTRSAPADSSMRATRREEIGSRRADRLLEAAVDLAVGERLERDRAEVDPQLVGDLRRQLGVRAPREEHEALVVVDREARGHCRLHLDAHDNSQSTRG